jgi:hypothetical protein
MVMMVMMMVVVMMMVRQVLRPLGSRLRPGKHEPDRHRQNGEEGFHRPTIRPKFAAPVKPGLAVFNH